MVDPMLQRALWAACLVFVGACASLAPSGDAPRAPLAPREVQLFRGDGTAASWSELVDAAAAAEVVFLGENHGHPLGLSSAAALFEDLLARCERASLSLEFFERDEQSRLDDYLAGVSDAATLERRTQRSEGNYPPGHRAMVELAKSKGRPVHASNAPRQYVRIASQKGYEPLALLSWEQRRLFRVPDELFTGRYRDDFDRIMTPSGRDPRAADEQARLARVFRSQQMWDWTMAESVFLALERDEAPVVQVIGRFHCDFRGGTVQALERLRPGTRALVVSYVDEVAPSALRLHDVGRGDFVLYVGPSAD
ncbi:MAG: ChaN family lipoprotein [Planctomycetes bacterium]|nr:ChaN family lipoprotein [Planctomycetota bacterium]